MKITKDMGIGEVLEKHPKVAEVFKELQIHCVGCMASHFESIEEGFTAHGMSEEEIDAAVKKMNAAISEE
ncbi:DUF1858 domain-containing protein [archaeon]|jgi:hybrid cluster-associated redox disulfide protein|nr:DUF1858 domain-containing protein [archaeon]MBT3731046.1 DUF1858 domain-containing protein [archaeon]MBT4669716.1 DUF1858 domain-containing protein [archaeon]MBT5029865.1 DUF1858 domain-containing protein [archaeon]MBT5288437.1 DUF1858 domain-containing protein [archaeon]